MIDINSMMSMIGQLKQDPRKVLMQRFNIPENVGNDPQSIIQHLMNTGQVSQAQFNQAMQMKKMFQK